MKTKLIIASIGIGVLSIWIIATQTANAYKEYQYQNISRSMITSIDLSYDNWNQVNTSYDLYEEQKELLTHVCGLINQSFVECKYLTEDELKKFDRFEKGELVQLIKKKRLN